DEYLPGIPRGEGYLHAWTYTYFQRTGKESVFIGSLSEKTGFTLLLYDQRNGLLTVRKDLAGLQLAHSFPALDLWVGEGPEQALFDRYFQAMELPPPAALPALGWTSWYRHFTHISAEKLRRDLEHLADTPLTADTQPAYFQVDDGWQTVVGDWQSVKPEFSPGMAQLAADIRARGLQPGIWLAPFVAAKNSDLVKKHPDWLLKNEGGQPLRVGWNPMWGGWYFALDFYNGAVRDYLSGVFHVVLEKWGYELVKLDFLFAVCLNPPPGKTRGAVMHEAMEFLRRAVGPKRILACGAPLGSCFGLVDYCRIGGDIHLAWEHRLLAWLRHRERVSTLTALRSTLGRWQLNGRAFHNDPDVFILRETEQKLSRIQQHTVLIINVLLGNLLFTSDDLSQYAPEQTAELEGALLLRGSQVHAVREIENDVYTIVFSQENERFTAFCNLTKQPQNLPFAADKNAHGRIGLQPFETIVLRS
ncbi:MAG: glycoside hydrolase family 36 protein, partial [Saprospiraceae bacterium]